MLASVEANAQSFKSEWFEYPLLPLVTDSLRGPTLRDMKVSGPKIQLTSSNDNGRRDVVEFSSETGMHCTSFYTQRSQKDDTVHENVDWEWKENRDGRWYPSSCTAVASRGRLLLEMYATFKRTIHCFQFLSEETFEGEPKEINFGPIAGGDEVTTVREDGTLEGIILPVLNKAPLNK